MCSLEQTNICLHNGSSNLTKYFQNPLDRYGTETKKGKHPILSAESLGPLEWNQWWFYSWRRWEPRPFLHSFKSTNFEPSIMVHSCNANTQEADTRGSQRIWALWLLWPAQGKNSDFCGLSSWRWKGETRGEGKGRNHLTLLRLLLRPSPWGIAVWTPTTIADSSKVSTDVMWGKDSETATKGQTLVCMPSIPALRWLRQGDWKSKTSLGKTLNSWRV